MNCSDLFKKPGKPLLVKNFISKNNLDLLLKIASCLDNSTKQNTPRGFIAPCSFAQFEISGEQSFFLTTKAFEEISKRDFNLLYSQLLKYFETLYCGLNIKPLILRYGTFFQECPLFSFRLINADEAGMHIHCHNQLHELNPSFAKLAQAELDLTNDISYFILLQKPENGGELVLFDIEWKAGQRNSGNDFVIQPDGSLIDINNPNLVNRQKVEMQPGDMVVFESGKTWHQITAVQGSVPRITLGGFFSKNLKGDTIFYYT